MKLRPYVGEGFCCVCPIAVKVECSVGRAVNAVQKCDRGQYDVNIKPGLREVFAGHPWISEGRSSEAATQRRRMQTTSRYPPRSLEFEVLTSRFGLEVERKTSIGLQRGWCPQPRNGPRKPLKHVPTRIDTQVLTIALLVEWYCDN